MLRIIIITCIFLGISSLHLAAQKGMTNKKMDKIFKEEASKVEGTMGNWQMIYEERLLFVLTDEAHNRMRIFTPVVEEKELDERLLKHMLEANFHSALDAKYSLYEGFVVTVYTHPLKELTEAQLKDAMQQVATLAYTFGTTFSSTDLIFGQEQETDKKVNESPSGKKLKKS